jgi:DNA ligase-1
MDYADLVRYYEEIEATTKRLEMTDILVNMLRQVPPDEMRRVILLTQGKVLPDFAGPELGLAEKLVVKAIAFSTGLPDTEITALWKEKGDMGLVGAEALERMRQTSLFPNPLTVERVYDNLLSIAQAKGAGSQEQKLRLLADLMNDAEPAEAKYILRTVMGKMRLGVADMTIVDALAAAFAEKERRDEVERAYNVSSDLGRVAEVLARDGIEALRDIHLEVGIPLRAMLSERLPSVEEIFEKLGRCAFEYKYDGLRVQAHVSEEVRLFSRRLEDITGQFPDLVDGLREAFTATEAVVEGEAVPVDPNTGEFLPFQVVSHRRGRKFDLDVAQEEYPVRLYLFDCLYLDGADLTAEPLETRRKALESCIDPKELVQLGKFIVTEDPQEADAFFHESIAAGCEGLMAKALDSPYQAGSRGWNWIKYKREYKAELSDTLDLVVVGAFAGRGRRAGFYGTLLLAAYREEDDTFPTLCKMGSGLTDEDLAGLEELLAEWKVERKHPRVVSDMEADYWFSPGKVLEIRGAEVTLSPVHKCGWGAIREGAGLAIRFPRFTGRWREDKAPEDATTEKEVVDMYREQLKRAG